MKDQKAHGILERRLEEGKPLMKLVEHPRADLGVAEKVHLAVG